MTRNPLMMPCTVLIACLLLCSCTVSNMVQTDLYFAQKRPDGSLISEADWQRFRNNQIAKVYKEGCTVINASGNWFDPDTHQLITEPAHLVIYYYKKSAQKSQQIDSLRYWYKQLFQQQSVLRVDKKVKAVF